MMTPEPLDQVVGTSPCHDDGLAFSAGRRASGRSARADDAQVTDTVFSWRRTPRVSLIVVLPEGHEISQAELADRAPIVGDDHGDVIVACAGRPANLQALQRSVRSAQFLFAPAGTTAESLREMAMQHASGDIVTLISGALLAPALSHQDERQSC
jgi:hypothetical protein